MSLTLPLQQLSPTLPSGRNQDRFGAHGDDHSSGARWGGSRFGLVGFGFGLGFGNRSACLVTLMRYRAIQMPPGQPVSHHGPAYLREADYRKATESTAEQQVRGGGQ
jgi:hypothetical protein